MRNHDVKLIRMTLRQTKGGGAVSFKIVVCCTTVITNVNCSYNFNHTIVYMLTQLWPCYCTVHGGAAVLFCDIVFSLWVEAKRICTCVLLLCLYICIAVGDPFIKGERIGIPLTGSGRKSFVQSQAKCPSSCVVAVFFCSIWIWG